MITIENLNAIFPKGAKASADYFTGTAWVNILVPKDETGSYAIVNVVFEPGCRNNWHTHPAGQISLITDGKGYYQERGKPAKLLTKGDEELFRLISNPFPVTLKRKGNWNARIPEISLAAVTYSSPS